MLLGGFAAALALAGAWVGLTAATGSTYHLAPLIVAAAPAVLARAAEAAVSPIAAVVAGAIAAAAGWVAIVIAGVEPTATVIADQPGGVAGEVVVAGIVGLAIGYLVLVRRPVADRPGPGRRGGAA